MSLAMRAGRNGAALSLFFIFPCLASCAETPADVRTASGHRLPYEGHAAELFEDGIEPAAVGYSADDVSGPTGDRLLRERTLTADGVFRARIVTLTSRESQQGWLLGLHPIESVSDATRAVPGEDLSLQVDATDPAAGLLRTFEGPLVGMTVIAFVRAFSGTGEARSLRFHLAPDNSGEIAAIRAAALWAAVR